MDKSVAEENNMDRLTAEFRKKIDSLFKSRKELPIESQFELRKLMSRLTRFRDDIQMIIATYMIANHSEVLPSVIVSLRPYINELQPFFSPLFLDTLRGCCDEKTVARFLRDILSMTSLSDVFALLALTITNQRTCNDKMILVYFDNLDRVDLSYLASNFVDILSDVLLNTTLLFKEERILGRSRDLGQCIRFVFCMREATHAIVNPQVHAGLRRNVMIVPFRHDGDMSLCAKVLLTRLDLASKVFKGVKKHAPVLTAMQDLQDVVSIVLSQSDEEKDSQSDLQAMVSHEQPAGFYFSNVISPLFNCDMKKLMDFLVKESDKGMRDLIGLAPAADRKNSAVDGRIEWLRRYGLGGDWMFRASRAIIRDEFASGYFAKIGKAQKNVGHCLLMRMMLNVLLNEGGWSYRKMSPPRVCSLDTLIRSLIGMYDLKDILDCLAEMFLCHTRDWVNLVTIENRRVVNLTSLSDIGQLEEKHKFSQLAHLDAVMEWSRVDREKREECESIWVRINRSGFVFLKYVITHFEFYSALTGNERSLFACGASRTQGAPLDADLAFEFERTINSVLEVLRDHCDDMKTFYRSSIQSGRNMSPEQFKSSTYAFKYLGPVNAPMKTQGHFHITRLVNSMIGYIDTFRSFLMAQEVDYFAESLDARNQGKDADPQLAQHTAGMLDESSEIKVLINTKLVRFIRVLIDLHDFSDDPVSPGFKEHFMRIHKRIEASGFSDTRTTFRLPRSIQTR